MRRVESTSRVRGTDQFQNLQRVSVCAIRVDPSGPTGGCKLSGQGQWHTALLQATEGKGKKPFSLAFFLLHGVLHAISGDTVPPITPELWIGIDQSHMQDDPGP